MSSLLGGCRLVELVGVAGDAAAAAAAGILAAFFCGSFLGVASVVDMLFLVVLFGFGVPFVTASDIDFFDSCVGLGEFAASSLSFLAASLGVGSLGVCGSTTGTFGVV
jgi:hypothetical protein